APGTSAAGPVRPPRSPVVRDRERQVRAAPWWGALPARSTSWPIWCSGRVWSCTMRQRPRRACCQLFFTVSFVQQMQFARDLAPRQGDPSRSAVIDEIDVVWPPSRTTADRPSGESLIGQRFHALFAALEAPLLRARPRDWRG